MLNQSSRKKTTVEKALTVRFWRIPTNTSQELDLLVTVQPTSLICSLSMLKCQSLIPPLNVGLPSIRLPSLRPWPSSPSDSPALSQVYGRQYSDCQGLIHKR